MITICITKKIFSKPFIKKLLILQIPESNSWQIQSFCDSKVNGNIVFFCIDMLSWSANYTDKTVGNIKINLNEHDSRDSRVAVIVK